MPRPAPFTPTQPRQGRSGLVGRTAELARILQALREDHAHVVIYSERGRGKTSLANAVVEGLRQDGTVVARYSCEADSRFDEILRGLLRGLPPGLLPEGGESALLPAHAVRPADVFAMFAGLDCRSLVCVVDEFDRVEEAATAARMADTIKAVSDRGAALQFMIVGVSENLEQILGKHPSIQRNIVAVQLPLLSDDEVVDLVQAGMRRADLTLPPDLLARVVLLARGSPHTAQLLGLRLVQAMATRGAAAARSITEQDFGAALDVLLRETLPRDAMLWDGLTINGRAEDMVTALHRLAGAGQDGWGRIEVEPLADGAVQVDGRMVAASVWRRIEATELLRAVPPGSGLYMFRHRSTMHTILMLTERMLPRPEPTMAAAPVRLVAASP